MGSANQARAWAWAIGIGAALALSLAVELQLHPLERLFFSPAPVASPAAGSSPAPVPAPSPSLAGWGGKPLRLTDPGATLSPEHAEYLKCLKAAPKAPSGCKLRTPVPMPSGLVSRAGPPPSSPHEFSFAQDAFAGGENCLILRSAASLTAGEKLLAFSPRSAPQEKVVEGFIRARHGSALFEIWKLEGIRTNRSLLSRIGCVPSLGIRDETHPWIGAVSLPAESFISLRNLPPAALAIGGAHRALSEEMLKDLHARALQPGLPGSCRPGSAWRNGFGFGPGKGQEISRLNVGSPVFAKGGERPGKVLQVKVCALTFHNGRLIGFETAELASPPGAGQELTERNWFSDPARHLGFLSLDQGKTWYSLEAGRADEGNELVHSFAIRELGPNGQTVFSERLTRSR
jgi:hypothetical protein